MIVVDTSVAVAAALPWHESHSPARSALARANGPLIAHVAIESYSVLTRLPPPHRVPAGIARTYLREAFALPPIALSPDAYAALLDTAATEGIAGGAVYDALVGATAGEASATLLTLDRRAVATYELLRVEYELVA